MVENIETNANTEENEAINSFRGELNALCLNIKKEAFKAKEELKAEIKRLGFYDGDESGENIKFNISKVKEYLQKIRNKSWTDLEVRSSKRERGVRTIAIQIAITYINNKDGKSINNIDFDGYRGNNTRELIKQFQTKYKLVNKDGLPGHETITKILELLENNIGNDVQGNDVQGNDIQGNDIQGNGNGGGFGGFSTEPDVSHNNEILQNFEIYGNFGGKYTGEMSKNGNDFENNKNSELKNTIFQNPEIQNILNSIVRHQSQEIENIKLRYNQIKALDDKTMLPTEIKDDNEEILQSWEEYKLENFSQNSFEQFIASDEGISIIMDEIGSHIDTTHKNENGKYDKFYEKYPFSAINLEIKLKNAWKSKIQSKYYLENYGEEKGEEMEKLDVISNQIIGYIDEIVGNYIKSGNENFNQDIIGLLEGLLSKGTNEVSINDFFSDQDYKDAFKGVLSDKIKSYEVFVRNKDNDIDFSTLDKQSLLQLKSYLYIYGNIFYSNHFKSNKNSEYYEDILPEIIKSIISNDDISLLDKINHKEFLITEKKLEEERKKRDLKRRQEAAKLNRERNKSYSSARGIGGNKISTRGTGSSDLDGATGAEIVEKSDINLSDIKSKGNNVGETILNNDLTKRAFGIAWGNFKKSNRDIEIESIFTREKIERLYIIEGNDIRFNENARNEFLESDIMKGRSQEEIDKIYNRTKSFPDEFYNALKIISSGISKQEKIMDEETKKHALGSVIDNVKSIFDNIVGKWKGDSNFEGFRFDVNNPVKREGDDIIMSGTFNGSAIKIRYDLNSGELFINSFLQTSPGKIIVGNNNEANVKILELDSFDTILDKHYHTPDILGNIGSKVQYPGNQTTSIQNPGASQGATPSNPGEDLPNNTRAGSQSFQPPISGVMDRNKKRFENIKEKYEAMLYAKIDMIGDKIMENTKKQSAINSSVMKFMKTFNIIIERQEDKTVEFNDGSDLFDFLEIINKSDSNTLDKFQLSMEKIVELSGLRWGANNISGPQENLKPKDTFDENSQNKNISLIRNCREDFSAKLGSLKENPSFETGYQFGFAQLVKKNFINKNISKPNRKLDETEMRRFFIDAGIKPPF